MAPRYREDLAVIGFDMDDVTHCLWCGWEKTLRRINHPTAGHPAWTDHAPHDWEHAANAGMTRDDFAAIMDIGTDLGTIFDGKPIVGAQAAVNRAYDAGHRIVIITARDTGTVAGRARIDTARWLSRWGFRYDDLVVSEDKTAIPTDAFLDDRVKNVTMVNDAGAVGFLQVRNHNRGQDYTGLRPVDTIDRYVDAVIGHTPASLREFYGVPA